MQILSKKVHGTKWSNLGSCAQCRRFFIKINLGEEVARHLLILNQKMMESMFFFRTSMKVGRIKKSEKTYAQKMYQKDTRLQLDCHKWSFSFIPGRTSFSSRNYINLLDAKSNDSKVELISYVAETSEVLTNIKKKDWKFLMVC